MGAQLWAIVRRDVLLYVVFFTGLVVLAVEVLAVRILAPYFGNTIFSFSSVISVILAALSAGYWYGGRMADKRPESSVFYRLVFASGLSVLAVHIASAFLLPVFAAFLPLTYGPLIAAFVLFFFPAFVFGLLSPFVIKLRSVQLVGHGIGTISGEVFFWSTCGSIAGSLLSGFYLVPIVGVQAAMLLLGASTACIGLVGMRLHGGIIGPPLIVLFSAATASSLVASAHLSGMYAADANVLFAEDGRYERIVVLDTVWNGVPGRILQLDRSYSSGTSYPGGEPLFEYMRYYALYKHTSAKLSRALVLGAGTGSIATALAREYPGAIIDIVDIEPRLFSLAHTYFLMPENERIRTHEADGRLYLRSSKDTYDLIFADMYSSLYSVPWHVSTREHYQLVYDRLADRGMYIGNYIAALDMAPPSLFGSHLRTLHDVFDDVYAFAVDSPESADPQNIILVATKGDVPLMDHLSQDTLPTGDPDEFARHLVPYDAAALEQFVPYTDDRAPVELHTAELLRALDS